MRLSDEVYAHRKPKTLNYDAKLDIRISSKLLEDFKAYYGKNWRNKLRNIMQESINRDKAITQNELARRYTYLHK